MPATAAPRPTAGRLLPLLHLLSLLRVPLLQLLRLLLVLLLHLLYFLRRSILLGQLLMFAFLSLLQILPFLCLLRRQALLLLLIFLIQFCVARIGCCTALDGRQFFGMRSEAGARSCRNRRVAVIRGDSLLRVIAC